MQKNELEEIYRTHHKRGSRYGYLFCHGSRVPYVRDWIGVGKKVLDLGCRDGMLTQTYARGNEVVGVDIDRDALELVRRRLGIETHWLDLNGEWPFAPHSFDCVVACEILEHLFFLEPFLKKVAETIRPGGIFIGSVPNAFRIRNRMKFLFGNEFENDPTHVRMFSYQKIHSTLSRYFGGIEIIPLQGKILPFLPVSCRTPQSLNRLFCRDLLWKSLTKK